MDGFIGLFLSAFTQQNEPEGIPAFDAEIDHLLVSFFENVQRQNDIGEQDDVR